MRRKTIETCEMCSANVENPITIKVEGALLRVCPRCTSFGNVVKERPKPQKAPVRGRTSARPVTRRFSGSKSNKRETELISDYAQVITRARQRKRYDHERLSSLTGITVASLKSIETGKMRPTDRDAKKIERELDIVLFAELDIEPEFAEKKKKKATTLGDIAVIRRYEYDRD